MINLLPRHKKKELRLMYRLRIVVVWLAFIILYEFLVVFMFLPSFYNVYSSVQSLQQKLEDKRTGAPKDTEQIQNQITKLKGEIELLRGVGDVAPVHIIDTILAAKNNGITIWGIFFDKSTGGVQLRGFATTRDSLTVYRKQLREVIEFQSVEIPPSLLLRESDIDFTARIELKK